MRHTYNNSLGLLALALGSFAYIPAFSQIAPLPYTPVPASPPDSPAMGTALPSKDAPRAFIQGWSFGNELEPAIKGIPSQIRLDPGARDIVIFFDAASTSTAPVEYRYALTDYDSDWSVTRNRIAHFHHLPPGEYRFIVQAHAPGQPWSTPQAEVSIVQLHFFYQTWYFYMLLLIGLVALAIELLRQRDQLLKGQIGIVLDERNRIASDCHDTLMVGLAAISWQLEATSKLLVGSDDKSLRVAQSCDLARKMVAHCQAEARRIIWDLRDSDEITNTLSHALSRVLTENGLRENVDLTFDVEGTEIPLAPAAVHHLVCIGQEAVSNSIRHSGATEIEVRLHYESESLNLTIRDDGCGFHLTTDPGIRTVHFGILVMQERARKLGGSFRINTAPGTGTEIILNVDFHAIHSLIDTNEQVVPWIGV
jgi:signal transduction histidine kinase